MNPPSITELRALCAAFGVELDEAELAKRVGGDPRAQRLLLSAMVVAAAERSHHQEDLHAQQVGLHAVIQQGTVAILSLLQHDPAILLGYLAWRHQRNVVVLSHIQVDGSPHGAQMLSAATLAADAAADLLTALHGLMLEQAQPGSSNPELPITQSLHDARAALHSAYAEIERLYGEIESDPADAQPAHDAHSRGGAAGGQPDGEAAL